MNHNLMSLTYLVIVYTIVISENLMTYEDTFSEIIYVFETMLAL